MENSFLPEDQFGYVDFKNSSNINKSRKFIYIICLVICLFIFYFLFLSAPADFPLPSVVRIEKGSSLRNVSSILKKQNIIHSRTAFEFFVIIMGGEKHMISANYLFENKLPVFEIARRISGGEHNMAPVTLTIPEGLNLNQIADMAVSKLVDFDKAKFLLAVKDKEGYLFPDTYFFLVNANEIDVIKSMTENFEKKLTPLLPEISSSGKTKKDIIIMASIIEWEAKGDTDRGVISGILWKRIKIGMPLQVDAALETYKTKGLPRSPIGNPGLEAIKASIHPQSSPYFYYLHDKNGNIYYAKTFSEHKENIARYLK